MKQEELKGLSTKELKKKEKDAKILIGIFIPLIIGLFYFPIRDYLSRGELDHGGFIIVICSIGGLVSTIP